MAASDYSQSSAKVKGRQRAREQGTPLSTASPLAEAAVAGSTVIDGGEVAPRKSAKVQQPSIIDRLLGLLSAVPFGITLLVFLIIACMIGMLIQQQEVEGFTEFYAKLT